MSTNFPSALDVWSNPDGADELVGHGAQHANVNDAIEALEAKVGINSSADTNSLDYRVAAVEIGKENAGAATSAIAAHEAATDPHPQYMTSDEGSAAFDAIGSAAAAQGASTPVAHATATDNPHSVTKAQVGLGSADNTSDADKPVSTEQQIALDSKQGTLVSGTNIMTLNGVSILSAGDLQVGGGIGASTTLFLNNAIAFADNYTLTPTPTGLPETIKSAVCNSGVSAGVGFIERYVSEPIGGSTIEGGIWRFNTYASTTSNTGLNRVVTRVNKRSEVSGVTVTMTGSGQTRTLTATGGTPFIAGHATASALTAALVELPTQTAWVSGYTSPTQVTITLTDGGFINVSGAALSAIYTLMFSVTTGDITGNTAALYLVESTQPAFACVPSDRLVLAYFGVTDSGSNRSIGIYYDGQTHYSNTETPIAQRHNQLGGLNEGEYLHMSAADRVKFDGIEASANNYNHPASHPPSIITQDADNRFVTDAEKSTWNAKEPGNPNIQTHIGSTSNPHSVTAAQVGLGNVDNTSNATERAATAQLTNKTIIAPTLTLKNSSAPVPTAEGDIQWDSDGDFIVVGNGTAQTIIPSATSTHTLTNKTWNGVAIGAGYGGTGQSSFAIGDTLYASGATAVSKLAGNITTTKKFLRQTGSGAASAAPAWDTLIDGDIPAALTGKSVNGVTPTAAVTGFTLAGGSTTSKTLTVNNTLGLSGTDSSTLNIGAGGTLGTAAFTNSTAYSPVAGSASITTVGTVATGTWSATAIAANKGGTGQTAYAVGDLLYAPTTSTVGKLADVAVGSVLISGGLNTAPSYGKVGLTTHVSGTLPVANGGTGGTTQITALQALGALGAQTVAKSAAYTVAPSDRGDVLLCTGTFTLTLTAAATLANGFSFGVVNVGTGVITIDPNLAELIDGAATLALAAGKSCLIVCDGTGWYSIGLGTTYQVFTKKLTGTTPSTVNGAVSIAHGLPDPAKILAMRLRYSYDGTSYLQDDYQGSTYGAYAHSLVWDATNVSIISNPNNIAAALSKSCTILVWYEG